MVRSGCFISSHLLLLLVVGAIAPVPVAAQSKSRISQPVNDQVVVPLKGNVHPLARSRFDQGAAPDSFPARHLFLILERSAEREARLRQFIRDAHTPGSSRYHKWLKPEQLGALYGPDDTEVATVSKWLKGQGFAIERVTKGKTAIEFSGNAGQLRRAFHTEIHTYLINGEVHHANNLDPQIPAALAPVIAGVTALNDFPPKSYVKLLGQASYDRSAHKLVPQWTFPGQATDLLDLGPGDFALQYDLSPLYSAGITGKGVTIGIIGASNVDPAVVAAYRSFFGLPKGQFNVVIDGEDPGENGALVESYLDVELAGAVAPEATVNLYTSAGSTLEDGLHLAAQRAVDDDVATVLSTSYGICEQHLGAAGNLFWASLWEQAAAQGQTSFVSAGDGGPAGCDNFDASQPAMGGTAVNGFASTPWDIAVGGTDFYYSSYNDSSSAQQPQLEKYWDTTGTLFPTTSLLQRVPEQVWNRAFGLNLANGGVYSSNQPTIIAGSGGPSLMYSKPSWQMANGVPTDNARDLPDVSLFAAAFENDTAYPICTTSFECLVENGDLTVSVVGGTSASSPAMAGIMALINQKYGAQGQANFVLYPLAAQHPSAFNDITSGSNVVPCQPGTPNCFLSTQNDNTRGFYTLGYYAAPGFDLASGLGSIDANLLVNFWTSLSFRPTTTTLSLSSTTFTHGTPINLSVGVTGNGGTPSGDVALVSNPASTSNIGLGEITLASGSASATVNRLPGGQYRLAARYGGDNVFASSSSPPVSLNVAAENSAVSLSGNTFDISKQSFVPVRNGSSYPYGTYIAIDAQVRGASAAPGASDGVATGTFTFSDTASAGNTNSGPLTLDRASSAEWVPTTVFAVGTHSLSASYSGDASFNRSASSSPVNFKITKVAPSITIGFGPNLYVTDTIGLGAPETLTALVGIGAAAAPPSGLVTFFVRNTKLGTATLGPAASYYPDYSAASLTVSNLPLGTDSITATYNGDKNYLPATAAPATVTVMHAATMNANVKPSTINPLQGFTVTAQVSVPNDQRAPTGVVEFDANGPGDEWFASGNLVNGSANFSFPGSIWSPGTINVAVEYSGDSFYAPVNINVPVTVTNAFTLSATPVTIAGAGATSGNTSTITVTPANGFTGNIYFSCTIEYYPAGAQQLPTCNVPTSVNLAGTSPITAAMTINSMAGATAALAPLHKPERLLLAQLGVLIGAFFLVGVPRCRVRRPFVTLLVVIAMIASFGGCGGVSGGGGTNGNQSATGTTPGNYIFMLEGSYTAQIGSTQPQVVMVNVTIQ